MAVIFVSRDLVDQSRYVITCVRKCNKTGESIDHDGVGLFFKARVSAPGFYFTHLIFSDNCVHVVSLCLVALLS